MSDLEKRVIVSEKSLNREQVLRDFNRGLLSRIEASELMEVSQRTVSRALRRLRQGGILELEHKNSGRAPWNKVSEDYRVKVLTLLKGKYFTFNLKHFHEHLIEVEKIELSYSAVKRIARHAKITRSRKRRSPIRKKRKRHSASGYMLQMDGSDHKWFGNMESCLVAAIDDASSEIPHGAFFRTESLECYMRVIRYIVENKGVPRVLYVDRASWLSGISDDERGQFYRICDELGVRVIYANSPEGKGRVERTWGTLQDRLVSELRLHGIKTMDGATEYFNKVFIPKTWKKKFEVIPTSSKSYYRPAPKKEDLDQIFCLKFERKIRRDHTILWRNEIYQINAPLPASLARYQAEIRIYLDGEVKAYFAGRDLELTIAKNNVRRTYPDQERRITLPNWLPKLTVKSQYIKQVE